MRLRALLRFVPALLVAVLIALSLAPARSVRATAAGASLPALNGGVCDQTLQSGSTGAFVNIGPAGGVTQPLGVQANVAACSLSFGQFTNDDGNFRIYQWDPLTLAPDPTTVALRSVNFSPSALQYNHLEVIFNPPVVTRQGEHLAEPPGEMVALDFQIGPWQWEYATMPYQPNDAPEVPVGFSYGANGARTLPPGVHPVFAHRACGGSDVLQKLSVMQSVMRSDAALDINNYEYAQRFRVPVRTALNWVEVAFGSSPTSYGLPPGTIAIYDADGQSVPPTSLPASLVQANYSYQFLPPGWNSHFDFDHIIILEPDHDYWLLVRTVKLYSLYARQITGTEGADFTSRIGPLLTRTASAVPWIPVANRALDFRLIGSSTAAVGVRPPATSRAAFTLIVAPNPAHGIAFIQWNGAEGPVRFVVVDERGRRVSSGASDAVAGRWQWTGRAENGSALPAGIYFVRAEDSMGRTAMQRIALVR